MKRFLKIVLFTFIGIFLLLIFIAKTPFSFTSKTSNADFSHIQNKNLKGNEKVVDIAMLGAHDALSFNIKASSKIDPNDKDMETYSNGFVKFMLDGIIMRNAKAQKSSASELLKAGVRYFDIRLTYCDGVWYTMHGMISLPFSESLKQILSFLSETKELLILDFQHVFVGNTDLDNLINLLQDTKINAKNIFHYAHYNSLTEPINSLTYSSATSGGSGVILIFGPAMNNKYIYQRETNLRSLWHNQPKSDNIIKAIKNEMSLILDDFSSYESILRVNQAQQTPWILSDIFGTIFGWSLLDKANIHNPKILTSINMEQMFKALPILMVDYANCANKSFNTNIIKIINIYNSKLI